MTETIIVDKNVAGKWGPQVMVGKEYVSFGKFYKGPKELPIGVPLTVDVFVTEAGKKYINKIETLQEEAPKPKTTKKAAEPKLYDDVPVVKEAKAEVKTEVKTDWAAKDRSQLVGGRSHDAASLVNTALITGTPLADVLNMYQEALKAILKTAGEVK